MDSLLLNETLDICSDGSFMPDLSQTAYSGAFIVQCRESKQEIRACFTDNSLSGDNYTAANSLVHSAHSSSSKQQSKPTLNLPATTLKM
jgi:hypothetical protein